MLCAFLGAILIVGIAGQTTDERKCVIPPPIVPYSDWDYLNYQLFKEQKPVIYLGKYINGTNAVYSYLIKVKCNPGYTIFGSFLVSCDDGEIVDLPSCVTDCEVSGDDKSLVSCGMGFDNRESKCTIPSGGIAGFAGTGAKDTKCGRLASGTFVVGGEPAKHGDVPWHVGIYTKTTQPFMQVCGGTLIKDNVVISAAHCFWNDVDKKLPAENFAVAAGKIYRPWNAVNDTDSATKSDIREIRIPPRYRGGATNFQDDLAVLLLSTRLKIDAYNVVPACIDFDNTIDETQLQDGTIGRVAGWGLTSADGAASQILNVVQLPVVDIERCINGAEPSFLTSITSDKICAGYNNGTTVCRGDSGGGLAIPQKDFEGDQYFLRGVVSTAPKSDHLCNVYAVATFTQITSHEFFIKAALTDARTVADTVTPLIEDTAATTTSPNKTANDPTDKPPVNPLNTDVTDVDTDTDVDDVGIAANKPDRKPPIRPASKPTANKGNKKPNQNKPTGRPPHWWMTETEKPIYDANGILFAVNSELNPELFAQLYPDYYPNNRTLKPGDNPVKNSTYPVTDEISDRFNNKNDTLDINKAITNAPPTESILDNIPNILQRPTNTQEVIENTNNNAPGTTPVRDPTAFVNKPMVSDLLPVNLDQNSNKPAAAEIPVLSSDTTTSTVTSTRKPVPSVPLEFGILDQATQAPVSSIGNADQKPFSPGTLEDHPLVPSLPELVHKPGLAQGPVPSKPSTEKPDHEYRPPHHHQNDPDYNDWKYWHDNWHNDPQNWNNYHHHNCHDHDYHYNWNHHQNWHHQYQDWPNYHRNGNNNQNWQNHHHEWSNDQQNRPNDHQYWQNDYQNQANYQQNWQNHYQNGPNNHRNQRLDDPNRKYEQYLHDLLVQSWFKRN